MLMLSLFRFAAAAIPWMLNLATRLLARSLNMPEPVVHDTGIFVFAQVVADMNGFGSFGSRRGSMCVHGGKPTMRISSIPLRPR